MKKISPLKKVVLPKRDAGFADIVGAESFPCKSMRDSEAIAERGAGSSTLTKMIVQRGVKVDEEYR
jgi:hypothetical protein